MTSLEGISDTDAYVQVGERRNGDEVELSIEDARRLRDIGRNVMFSSGSDVDAREGSIVASLLASANFNRSSLPDFGVSSLYMMAQEFYSDNDDQWRSVVRRHSYRRLGPRESLDMISEYEVEVWGDDVLIARRGLYKMCASESFHATDRSIEIQRYTRRTKTETPLLTRHIDQLNEHSQSIIKRAEANPRRT